QRSDYTQAARYAIAPVSHPEISTGARTIAIRMPTHPGLLETREMLAPQAFRRMGNASDEGRSRRICRPAKTAPHAVRANPLFHMFFGLLPIVDQAQRDLRSDRVSSSLL